MIAWLLGGGHCGGYGTQLGGPEQEDELTLGDARQAALLHPHLRAGAVVDSRGEVGVVPDQQDLLAVAVRELAGVERPAAEAVVELDVEPAQLLAHDPRGVGSADHGARHAGIEMDPESRQRGARHARLFLAMLRERPFRVRRTVGRLRVTQQPDHNNPDLTRCATMGREHGSPD